MAISGHAGIGLDIFRHGYCHKSSDAPIVYTCINRKEPYKKEDIYIYVIKMKYSSEKGT